MPEPARTALYRFFDAEGRLLYVGITGNPERRWKRHACDKPWWPQVAEKTIEWFDNILAAGRAEKDAIRDEEPLHNKISVPAFHQMLQERARQSPRRRRR